MGYILDLENELEQRLADLDEEKKTQNLFGTPPTQSGKRGFVSFPKAQIVTKACMFKVIADASWSQVHTPEKLFKMVS